MTPPLVKQYPSSNVITCKSAVVSEATLKQESIIKLEIPEKLMMLTPEATPDTVDEQEIR